jgi:anti-sigma regulatory factor (Ser/Thr protein kinase)
VRDALDLRLTNDLAELPRLARAVDEFCGRHGLAPAIAFAFNLALEEAITNVIAHGYADAAAHEIRVRMRVADATVTAEVIDDGRPFDPLQVERPDLTGGIEDRRLGGLGIFLMRRSMDEVRYRTVGRHNCLELSKRIA